MFPELSQQLTQVHSHIELILANYDHLLLNTIETVLHFLAKRARAFVGFLKSHVNALKPRVNALKPRFNALSEIVDTSKDGFDRRLCGEVIGVHIELDNSDGGLVSSSFQLCDVGLTKPA